MADDLVVQAALKEQGWLGGGYENMPCIDCKVRLYGAKGCIRCRACAAVAAYLAVVAQREAEKERADGNFQSYERVRDDLSARLTAVEEERDTVDHDFDVAQGEWVIEKAGLKAQLAAMTAERDSYREQAVAAQSDRDIWKIRCASVEESLLTVAMRMDEQKVQLTASEAARNTRQAQMAKWCTDCFGPEAMSLAERGLRVGEEAAELAQAMGTPEDAFMRTVAAAYAKPVGDPAQEAGGVGTTLLAACAALDISADACEAMEFARIHWPEIIAKARARNERNKLDGTSVLGAEPGKAGEP